MALIDLSNRLDAGTNFLVEKQAEADRLSAQYDLAYARAILGSTKTNDQARRADALLACEQLFNDKNLAETVVRTTRDRIKALHYQIEIGRSLGANVRASTSAQ